jgi:hypothetical protein
VCVCVCVCTRVRARTHTHTHTHTPHTGTAKAGTRCGGARRKEAGRARKGKGGAARLGCLWRHRNLFSASRVVLSEPTVLLSACEFICATCFLLLSAERTQSSVSSVCRYTPHVSSSFLLSKSSVANISAQASPATTACESICVTCFLLLSVRA